MCRAFLRQSISQSVGEYGTRTRWYIRPSEIEQFISLDALEAALPTVEESGALSAEDERAVGAMREAISPPKTGAS